MSAKPLDYKPAIKPYGGEGYRVVEDQTSSATHDLVDTEEEHQLLERLIENEKPPRPLDCKIDDPLIYTPFRHEPPLKAGTRFGKITERSPYYGSQELETAFAEMAHRQFQFAQDTEADLPPRNVVVTSFSFGFSCDAFVDFTEESFRAFHAKLSSKDDYVYTQKIGSAMREDGVQGCKFFSVRRKGGHNYAIFAPGSLTRKSSKHRQWKLLINQNEVVVTSHHNQVHYRFTQAA